MTDSTSSFTPARIIIYLLFFTLGACVALKFFNQTPELRVEYHAYPQHENSLMSYFLNNKKKKIHKWLHYLEVYERHFQQFKDTDVVILEIGVAQGGSLQMWKEYFGPKATIVGADIDPNTVSHKEEQIDIMIGDQADPEFLAKVKEKYPKIDIVIDDGGHTMNQQITSFNHLFPHLSTNGVYLVEDTHTSYWSDYGGGLLKDGTFMEMSKGLVDHLNAWDFRSDDLKTNMDFTKSVFSMHFYPSAVVFEKRKMTRPVEKKTGMDTIPDYQPGFVHDDSISN